MEFIKYLQKQRPGNKLAIFWDGVTYYNFQAYREYLMTINQDLSEEECLINCTLICSKCSGAKSC